MLNRIIFTALYCILLIHYSAEESTNVSVTKKCIGKACFWIPEFNTSRYGNCSCQFYDFGELLCVENVKGFLNSRRQLGESTTDIINSSKNPYGNLLYYLIDVAQCKRIKMADDYQYFAVIDKCPEGKNSNVKHLCETPDTELPVALMSSPLNIIFQNAYCAKCHGAMEAGLKVSTWPSNVNCVEDNVVNADDMHRKLEEGTCEREYLSPRTGREAYCTFPIMAKQLLANECDTCYSHLESGQGHRDTLQCIMCEFGTRLDVDLCALSGTGSTLKSLFNLPTDTEVAIQINGGIFKNSDMCKDNEKYDMLFQKCREFLCNHDEFASRGRCLQNRTVLVSPESQLFPNGQNILLIKASLLDMSDSNYTQDILLAPLQKFAELLTRPSASSFKGGTSITFDLNLTAKNESSVDKLFQMSRSLYFDKEIIISLILDVASGQGVTIDSVCPLEGYIFDCLTDSEVHFYEDVLYAQYLDESRNRTLLFLAENIYFDLTIKSIDDEISFNKVCVCIPPNTTVSNSNGLNCSYTYYKYTPDEIQVLSDGKLKILGHQLEFEESEFYIQNGTAIVCFNPDKPRSFFDLDTVQVYLSWTCTGLSIICLTITIVIYSIFDELRNVPGRLTMALSICLILGQGLLIFPDLGVGICRYVAAACHFIWLSAFVWTSCQAINMVFTFHPKTLQSVDSWRNSNTFNWYLLISLSIPFIIVGTCLVLDMVPGDHLHVMYGLLSCGWMSRDAGIIYAFFVPVGVILVTNVICFGLAIHFIEQTMANSDKVTGRRRDRSRCIMYMKLSAVIGFSWIFGFVASFFDVSALWYVYIVLNGLQGVFIFLGFGINTRVRNIISTKWSSLSTFHDLFSSESRAGDNTQSATVRS